MSDYECRCKPDEWCTLCAWEATAKVMLNWGILDELKFYLLALILVGGCAGVVMVFLLYILKVAGEL